MKKCFVILTAIFLLTGMNPGSARNLQAYLSYSTFYSPEQGPYLETYLTVAGSSVRFIKQPDGRFQGSVEITFIFKKDKEIKDFRKYELLSPAVGDTANINFNFIDQQRFALPNGVYDFDIVIADKNNKTNPFLTTEPVKIDFPADKISVSGIELIDSYQPTKEANILSKSGYDMVPYVFNFFPSDKKKLTYYAEIYNAGKVLGADSKYLLTNYVEVFETGRLIPELSKSKKEVAKPVNVVFNDFDLTKLPSGNYNLVIEIRNQENKVVASNKLFFQQSNPGLQMDLKDIATVEVDNTFASRITNKDSLAEFIRCLSPISNDMEKVFSQSLARSGDLKTMQQYFYNFWSSRDNLSPEKAWNNYYAEVKQVNHDFKTQIRKGYETDRGIVYLKYGPPNARTESYSEPSAYPYEIWQYYTLNNNQRNKKFVFYTRDLVTNDFQLVHSDALGEISNYRWQVDIHKRDSDSNNFDIDKAPSHWGGKSDDYFKQPR